QHLAARPALGWVVFAVGADVGVVGIKTVEHTAAAEFDPVLGAHTHAQGPLVPGRDAHHAGNIAWRGAALQVAEDHSDPGHSAQRRPDITGGNDHRRIHRQDGDLPVAALVA